MGFDFEALTEATSGAVGGVLSTSVLYPLDTCKTKYQAEACEGFSRKYRSPTDVLREAISSRQLLSLYQGLGTKNLQSFISQFIYFYSYSYFKNLYLKTSGKKRMETGANLLVAAAAGGCTAFLTQPLDTASARMQTSSFGKSRSLWETLSQGDWKRSFDGLGASLILTSNPAIQYTVFEQLKHRFINAQRPRKAALHSVPDASPVVLSAVSAFLLGALSKSVATIVTYPAIRCKVLLQIAAESKRIDMNEQPPTKIIDAIKIIWHKEGGFGFYKGLQAQILKTVLSAALMLMIKEKSAKGTWFAMMTINRWLNASRKSIKATC